MSEIVPIDSETALNREPIHLRVTPQSFPEPLLIRLDWNPVTEKYTFEVIHESIDERVIKNAVTPYFPYWYRPYIVFSFIDESGQTVAVTPETLGDEVELYAFPGPGGQVE